MSGIIGSKLNIRGSGLVAKLGTDGQLFTSSGAGVSQAFEAAAAGGLYESVAIIWDEKSTGTAGGTFTSGAWRTRDLNTESDPDSIVTLSSNQFTLSAGTYTIEWTAPSYNVDNVAHQLYNIDTSTVIATGQSVRNYGNYASGTNDGFAITTIATGTDTYEIQGNCYSTVSTYGFGKHGNGAVEVYTIVMIHKHA